MRLTAETIIDNISWASRPTVHVSAYHFQWPFIQEIKLLVSLISLYERLHDKAR